MPEGSQLLRAAMRVLLRVVVRLRIRSWKENRRRKVKWTRKIGCVILWRLRVRLRRGRGFQSTASTAAAEAAECRA